MRRLLCSAAATAACLVASAVLSAGNAATVTSLGTSGDVSAITQTSLQTQSGLVTGSSQLSYTTDWMKFVIGPPPSAPSTSVTVNFLATLIYPGESWQVTTSVGGAPLFSGTANDTPVSSPLSILTNYYLEFASASAPGIGGGLSTFSIQVPGSNVNPTPLPGTLALFAGGLGLLGFTGWRKRNKVQKGMRLNLA